MVQIRCISTVNVQMTNTLTTDTQTTCKKYLALTTIKGLSTAMLQWHVAQTIHKTVTHQQVSVLQRN